MKKDPTSIGSILMSLGAVTEPALDAAVRQQQQMQQDLLIGKILVANGACTAEELDTAIRAQASMRNEDPHMRALDVADFALKRRRRKSVIDMRTRLRTKSAQLERSITGEDNPAITPAMLARAAAEKGG